MPDQSDDIEARRRAYGGSDRAAPSMNRLQYVKANSIAKARQLGQVVFLDLVVSGELGSQVGSSTVFLKARTSQKSRIGLRNLNTNPHEAKYISLGVLGADLRPLQRNVDGFALSTGPVLQPNLPPIGLERQAQFFPEGEFYFTINSSSFTAIPYAVHLIIEPQGYLAGEVVGSHLIRSRIGLIKLRGTSSAEHAPYGALRPIELILRLSGVSVGTGLAEVTMFVPRGSAFCQDITEGRLQMNHRIEGAAGGTTLPRATAAPIRRMEGRSTSTSINLGELTIPLGGYGA